MTLFLFAIFVFLLILIGGNRGVVTLISICGNIAILLLLTILIARGFHPIIITFISCYLICNINLFYQNGKNAKTIASFISVIIILIILFIITYSFGYYGKIGGLHELKIGEDDVFGMSENLGINTIKIAVSMVIMGLIGAVMDTSIAVSSAVYEVYKNNRHLSDKELFQSGMGIGKDILGTTVHTLYFAYIGESLMIFLLFQQFNYSVLSLINSKAFYQEFIYIILSAISCVLVIPITAYFISYIIKKPDKFAKFLKEDILFDSQNVS